MNQTLTTKYMTQEIRDIIEKEAEDICFYSYPDQKAYIAGATKYAELMIEFAEWVEGNVIAIETGQWQTFRFEEKCDYSTSDLLTIFLKEKNNKL